jgi:DNA helicase-2/ATP-dependent DNA helicase PcrA
MVCLFSRQNQWSRRSLQYTTLTKAQQKVVDHDYGPALVFAVAGAGKTTAMVHRIERLVREGVFPASQILATSFGKGNEIDLSKKLQKWPHCRAVEVRTLHALGRSIIVRAHECGHLRRVRLNMDSDSRFSPEQRLLNTAMYEARSRQLPFAPELDSIDRQDFFSYIDACKGNLRYADYEQIKPVLPPWAQKIAGQAGAPQKQSLEWYLDLYRLYEEVRLQQGVITFADMLMTGWQTLVLYEDILEEARSRYQAVLVDEFQDINLAQSEILDLITAPQRNYMAIGDDDQTIYEWRGASPRYILNFAKRYKAQRYLIPDNFRCPAGPLIFANRVIRHNQQRETKQLQLTRGFGGETQLYVDRDAATMAQRIVGGIQQLRQEGFAWSDMAVLVRINAQTPYIEQALIAAEIPFHVSKPFYKRWEIQTLIYYARLAWVEWAVQTGRTMTAGQKEWLAEAWLAIYNRPKRYVSRELAEQVLQLITRGDMSPTEALRLAGPRASHDGITQKMERLADDVAWLATRLKSDAASTLRQLELRLEYKSYLLESSGFPQTGEGRAAGVDAFIDYARGKGTVLEFMQHIQELAERKVGDERSKREDAVQLATIHAAKGLEWPVVFIAQANQSIMPFDGERADNMEEERRLFYVALTRSSRHLYIHATKEDSLSQFLGEASYRSLLELLPRLQAILQRNPQRWQAEDALLLARTIARHKLHSYFTDWWDAPEEKQEAISRTMQRFAAAVDAQRGWDALGLRPQEMELWQTLGGAEIAPEEQQFPGLEKLLAESKAAPAYGYGGNAVAKRATTRREKSTSPPPEPQPATIRPGMWVRSDAGWGRLERITDGEGQEVVEASPGQRHGRLYLTLRPRRDALPVEIDLEAGRLYFPQNGNLYTCTRCDRFSSNDTRLLTKDHNKAAHNGVGPSYRREKNGERPLGNIWFQKGPPREPLE